MAPYPLSSRPASADKTIDCGACLRRALPLATLLALVPATASAQTTSRFFGGLEFGLSTYEFAQKLDQKVVFTTANATGGVAFGRYNFIASYAFSLDDAEVSEEDFTGDAERTDLDLIVSRQMTDQISLFAGYKDGETELRSLSREDEDDGGPRRSESFEQEGLFLGASYTWQFENAGRLSFSVAYADLDADNKFVSDEEVDDEDEDEDEPLEFDDISGTASGDADGFSYNLTWTMPLRSNLLFRSKLRINRYQQDIDFRGQKFKDIDENSEALLLGLVYVF